MRGSRFCTSHCRLGMHCTLTLQMLTDCSCDYTAEDLLDLSRQLHEAISKVAMEMIAV